MPKEKCDNFVKTLNRYTDEENLKTKHQRAYVANLIALMRAILAEEISERALDIRFENLVEDAKGADIEQMDHPEDHPKKLFGHVECPSQFDKDDLKLPELDATTDEWLKWANAEKERILKDWKMCPDSQKKLGFSLIEKFRNSDALHTFRDEEDCPSFARSPKGLEQKERWKVDKRLRRFATKENLQRADGRVYVAALITFIRAIYAKEDNPYAVVNDQLAEIGFCHSGEEVVSVLQDMREKYKFSVNIPDVIDPSDHWLQWADAERKDILKKWENFSEEQKAAVFSLINRFQESWHGRLIDEERANRKQEEKMRTDQLHGLGLRFGQLTTDKRWDWKKAKFLRNLMFSDHELKNAEDPTTKAKWQRAKKDIKSYLHFTPVFSWIYRHAHKNAYDAYKLDDARRCYYLLKEIFEKKHGKGEKKRLCAEYKKSFRKFNQSLREQVGVSLAWKFTPEIIKESESPRPELRKPISLKRSEKSQNVSKRVTPKTDQNQKGRGKRREFARKNG